jgi:hypothetical protein
MAEHTLMLEETVVMSEPGAIAAGADLAASANPRRGRIVERSPALLRQVNELMREGRRGPAEPERIPFFCECERADCYEPVWLTSDMYDGRRSELHQPLILPGHESAGRRSAMAPQPA